MVRPAVGVRRLLLTSTPPAASLPAACRPASDDGWPWHFRHEAAFVFGRAGRDGRGLVMGHFAAGGREIVPVEECPVHDHLPQHAAQVLAGRRDTRLHEFVAQPDPHTPHVEAVAVLTNSIS